MHVWIVNQYAVPPSDPGGTRHHAFARSLIAAGHEATVVSSTFSHFDLSDRRPAAQGGWISREEEGVPWLWLWSPPYAGNSAARMRNVLHFARRVRKEMPKTLTRPDVIVGSSPQLMAADAARDVARQLGVPFVLEVRDLYPESLVELGNRSRRHPLVLALRRVERRLYQSASAIVTLLPGARAYIEERGASGPIEWIPNGVDLAGREPVEEPLCPPFRVLYTGAHGIANALDPVIDAAALLKQRDDIAFRLVGKGPQKARLQRRVENEGLDTVSFSGPVPKEDLFPILEEAHACVLSEQPRSLYRFGTSMNKLFDYMSAARPIVWATGDPHETLTPSGGGLIAPAGDARAMAAAIESLADSSPELRAEMGRKARAYVEQNHEIGMLGDRFTKVLERASSI